MKQLFLMIFAMLCFILETNAQIIHIPADQPTIQAGINSASEGDTILVAEGSYFENINFKGKPITVASQFILDSDTAHISRTVIDGSQYTDPDSASVVLMCSGEDTTSVLMGFTITGGTGSYLAIPWWKQIEEIYDVTLCGGGVAILNSGGMIIRNIIELNHIEQHYPEQTGTSEGGGLYACVNDNHTILIRNNIIRNNSDSLLWSHGGGVSLAGGRIILEQNTISKNTVYGEFDFGSGGAGICYQDRGNDGVIYEVIIRNNVITENEVHDLKKLGEGGGIILWGNEGNERIEPIQLYNNVISDNHVAGKGGGIHFGGLYGGARANVFNNTIWNNESTQSGKSLDVVGGSELVMVNNIIWSDAGGNFADFYSPKSEKNSVKAFYNILREPFGMVDQIKASHNTYLKPEFTSDSTYQPTAFSPAVGRGFDSLEVDGTWYVAPPTDLDGNCRPNTMDGYVDIGAFESEFSQSLLPDASLVTIQVPDHTLVPDFQSGILEYEVEVLDIYDAFDDLVYIPADVLSLIDYNTPTDILSESAADRTSTISVTSADGTVENIYKILYNALSTNAALSALSVGPYTLDPIFDPEVLEYVVKLPAGTNQAPEVTAVRSDENAEVTFYDATFADDSHRTTTIVVTPEAGRKFNRSYRILFDVETGVSDPGDNPGPRLYPNPFSTTATIEWQSNGIIRRIELVDMLGQTVRTIEHPQGTSVTLSRENLPSGIYFLKMYADQTLIRKVMIE